MTGSEGRCAGEEGEVLGKTRDPAPLLIHGDEERHAGREELKVVGEPCDLERVLEVPIKQDHPPDAGRFNQVNHTRRGAGSLKAKHKELADLLLQGHGPVFRRPCLARDATFAREDLRERGVAIWDRYWTRRRPPTPVAPLRV